LSPNNPHAETPVCPAPERDTGRQSTQTAVKSWDAAKIDALAGTPRPHRVETLASEKNLYRIGVGDYPIVYQIHDKVLVIILVRIRHRRDVYQSLG
jgi:mRNA interferase RelE/StbE